MASIKATEQKEPTREKGAEQTKGLDRVQAELDSNPDLKQLRQLSLCKTRRSVTSKQFDLELGKNGTRQRSAVSATREEDNKRQAETEARVQACLAHAPLGEQRMRVTKEMRKYEQRIKDLYDKRLEFKFKSLQPWIVLEPGDVLNAQLVTKLCEKQSETVQQQGYHRPLQPPPPLK